MQTYFTHYLHGQMKGAILHRFQSWCHNIVVWNSKVSRVVVLVFKQLSWLRMSAGVLRCVCVCDAIHGCKCFMDYKLCVYIHIYIYIHSICIYVGSLVFRHKSVFDRFAFYFIEFLFFFSFWELVQITLTDWKMLILSISFLMIK